MAAWQFDNDRQLWKTGQNQAVFVWPTLVSTGPAAGHENGTMLRKTAMAQTPLSSTAITPADVWGIPKTALPSSFRNTNLTSSTATSGRSKRMLSTVAASFVPR